MAARFWVWHNGGWVRLSMVEGDVLETSTGDDTDEGYQCESVVWTHEGDVIRQEYTSWGRDCDGRHEYSCTMIAKIDQLAARDLETDEESTEFAGIFLPIWEKESSGQRDYAAEAMGY